MSIWRTMRARPAPRARRVLTSRSRAAARASSRFARLTQASRSTMPASEQHVGGLGERILQVVEAAVSGLELEMKLGGSFAVRHACGCSRAQDGVEFCLRAGLGDVGTQTCHDEQPP